ncbi:MAG: phosphate signaling complex protein PhoU [Elusimicrobiales bacterium]|nr:phosphate signaling complex protein PhoU [Elusimicrobiales bacterium]
MYRYFEDEIKEVKEALLNMSLYVEDMIYNSVLALKTTDTDLSKKIIEEDDEIDKIEIQIDEKCTEIIMRHHPLAKDLRFVLASLKINNDLERIADLTVDIAWRVIEISRADNGKITRDIEEMGIKVKDMLRNSIKSLTEENYELAKEVITSDKEIDSLKNGIIEEILKNTDKINLRKNLSLILAVRHLERIADHCVNISEDVIYILKARVVKHHKENL